MNAHTRLTIRDALSVVAPVLSRTNDVDGRERAAKIRRNI